VDLAILTPTVKRSSPPAGNEQLQRARLSIALASLTVVAPLLLFDLALVERKWKVLLNRGPFLAEPPLQWWGKVLFVCFFAAALLLLIITASNALWWAIRRVTGRQEPRMAKWTVLVVALAYFAAITIQYEVFQYFRDGLSLALIRGLSSGSWITALRYVQDEFAGLLPAVAAALVVMVLGGWLARRYSRRLASWLSRRRPVQILASPRGLLIANVVMIVLPGLLLKTASPLYDNLQFEIAYQVYALPSTVLTYFDRDRFGLGNGVDRIAGDPPKVFWEQRNIPWEASRLERKNVLLLVLESARYDLLDARVDGEPVMPVLSKLPGERLLMFSHAGYTVPSLCAMFNGTVDERGTGISLVDRFRQLGYQTGVFSGQYEGYGDVSERTHMNRADVFVDASSFPAGQRMYASTAASALSVPAPLVTERFRQWFRSLDHQRPFFAYVNWQELHFPYYYRGELTPLANPPIPRGEIAAGNREWLQRTYWNGARNLDTVLAGVLAELEQAGALPHTVILVVGDHGEELFDHGYLGHGTNISFEQNAPIGKLINSNWKPPARAFGMSSVSGLIHNALVRSPEDALPLDQEILCYTHSVIEPRQIAAVTPSGILKFDFKRKLWSRQTAVGKEFVANPSFPPLINLWQAYLQQLPRGSR